MTSKDLENDRDFTPDDGVFVSMVLETPRIKVARSGRALLGEVYYAQKVGGAAWEPFSRAQATQDFPPTLT